MGKALLGELFCPCDRSWMEFLQRLTKNHSTGPDFACGPLNQVFQQKSLVIKMMNVREFLKKFVSGT